MSKYFVRYAIMVPVQKCMGSSYKTEMVREERSYIGFLNIDSLFDVQVGIYDNDLTYMGDERPEFDDIDIISLNLV